MDPLAEHLKQTDKSPFAAFWNNPIRYIDPDGRFPRNSDNGENLSDGQRYLSDWTSKGATVGEGTGTAARVDAGQGGGWLDNIQTGLDVAGIADPTGIVDGVNALIYAGRGQWGNAGISALAIIPYIGDVGKAGRLGAKIVNKATKGGLSNSRALGTAGEEAVGVGPKTRIPSLTGTAKYRIPDQLTSTTIGEVKNVGHQSLTRQLTDFHQYSQQTGRQFILYTRPKTTFSGPLQNLINNRSIIPKPIPFR